MSAAPDKRALEEGADFTPRFRRVWADCLRNRRGRHAAGADGRLYEQARARQDHRVRRGALLVASRQSLWRKGETSGQVQRVVS